MKIEFRGGHNSSSERALRRTKHTTATIRTLDMNTAADFEGKWATFLHREAPEHNTMEGGRRDMLEFSLGGIYTHQKFFFEESTHRSWKVFIH